MLGSKPGFASKPGFGSKPRMLSKANPAGATASSSYIPSAIADKKDDKPPMTSVGGGYIPSAIAPKETSPPKPIAPIAAVRKS